LLTDAELLAILLRIGNKGSSAIDVGRELIAKLDDFSELIGHTLKISCRSKGWVWQNQRS